MKDVLLFICFFCLFADTLICNERHSEVINSIKEIEYKVDSLQTKYDSLQNILVKYEISRN